MKPIIILEILEKIRTNQKLYRNFKIFAVVGILGFIVTATLLIWAGVSTIKYVASSATEVIQTQSAQSHMANLKAQIEGLPKLQITNCLGMAQDLLSVQSWLARPAAENLTNLKRACFEQNTSHCEGVPCDEMKQLLNKQEGGFI